MRLTDPEPSAAAGRRRAVLIRRGLRLEYATLAWNVVEIGFLIVAAVLASSVALAGFAVDSVIEIFASVVVVWQLRGSAHPRREQRAVRLIGCAFLGLSTYLVAQIAAALAAGIRPDTSILGIVWLAATTGAMSLLAWGKARTGHELDNPVLRSEARVTVIDASLAATILLGLVLNAIVGWWWADLAAAAVLVVYGLVEGRAALVSDRTR